MGQYEDFVRHVLASGTPKNDRTGTGTVSVFGYQMRFDLSAGFPLVETKKVPFKSIAVELLWFLRGDSNVRWLQEQGVTIWDEWADDGGELRPVYGVQWRGWPPRAWPSPPGTPSSSSTWRAERGCPVSSTSARLTSSSACLSTSPATRC